MIQITVTEEVIITKLLNYALNECENEMLKYTDYSTFLKCNEDMITDLCLEHLPLIECNIIWDDVDWYYDQIKEELNSEIAINYIKEYFDKYIKI